MSESNYIIGTDALKKWKDDLLSGKVPIRYPIGTGALGELQVQPGRVLLFGGPPGAGKTALMMQAIIEALRMTENLKALVCSVEVPPSVLLDRQLARLSGIDASIIRDRQFTGAHTERLQTGLATLSSVAERLCFIQPPFNLANVAKAKTAFHAKLLLLDYVQRIPPPGEHKDTRTALNVAMNLLRQVADTGAAVMAVSSVARSKNNKGQPSYEGDGLTLASFRESSELEYGADDAFLLSPINDKDGKPSGTVTLRHLKSRHGPRHDILMLFDAAHQNFIPLTPEQALAANWDATAEAA